MEKKTGLPSLRERAVTKCGAWLGWVVGRARTRPNVDRRAGCAYRSRTADEVESLVIDATRKLGSSTLQQWARAAPQRAIARCKKERAELVVHVWGGAHRGNHAAHWYRASSAAFCRTREGQRAVQVDAPGKGDVRFGIDDSFASASQRLLGDYVIY